MTHRAFRKSFPDVFLTSVVLFLIPVVLPSRSRGSRWLGIGGVPTYLPTSLGAGWWVDGATISVFSATPKSGTGNCHKRRTHRKPSFLSEIAICTPKHPERTENRVFYRKSRFAPKTPRTHRKPSFLSEITICTQNTKNAPKTEFSIGNQVCREKLHLTVSDFAWAVPDFA